MILVVDNSQLDWRLQYDSTEVPQEQLTVVGVGTKTLKVVVVFSEYSGMRMYIAKCQSDVSSSYIEFQPARETLGPPAIA